jgi:16S rRNA (cytosine1402-N4)-methyltransferase
MKRQRQRSTPEGEHRAVMLDEILRIADVRPGQVVVDCTVGWAGHAAELLNRLGPDGLLIGLDMDAENLPRARERLAALGQPFHLVHGNFASLTTVIAELEHARNSAGDAPSGSGRLEVDFILADLGMSSMQVDEPERGFSYRRDGSLDMRMDRSRGRTAAQILQTIAEQDLIDALRDLADEPYAAVIAAAIVKNRQNLARTGDLARIVAEATAQTSWQLHPQAGRWNLHPAARTFQALRILVNREISNLENLVRIAPDVLRPGGKLAIISFHSGEDRVVKAAFRAGKASGVYSEVSPDPLRASDKERFANPRARSAKLRWAQRA